MSQTLKEKLQNLILYCGNIFYVSQKCSCRKFMGVLQGIFIPQFINLLFLILAHMGTCKIKACRYYLGQNKLCDPLILLHIEEKT